MLFLTQLPEQVRAAIYATAKLVAYLAGGLTVAFLAANHDVPTWLAVTTAVSGLYSAGANSVAGANLTAQRARHDATVQLHAAGAAAVTASSKLDPPS